MEKDEHGAIMTIGNFYLKIVVEILQISMGSLQHLNEGHGAFFEVFF